MAPRAAVRGRRRRRATRGAARDDCSHLLNNRHNFDKSSSPSHVMSYSNREWRDFSGEPLAALVQAFAARHPAVVVDIDEVHYLVDFLRMLQIDLGTGVARSIAWIDDAGKCFFPSVLTGGDVPPRPQWAPARSAPEELVPTWVHPQNEAGSSAVVVDGNSASSATDVVLPPATPCVDLKNRGKAVVVDGGAGCAEPEEGGDETPEPGGKRVRVTDPDCGPSGTKPSTFVPVAPPGFEAAASPVMKMVKLSEKSGAYQGVRNMFQNGMREVDPATEVTAVRWIPHMGATGAARVQAFQRSAEAAAVARGDANIRYAWYGSDPTAIEHVVLHGFRQVDTRFFSAAYGVGIYLSPEAFPQSSAAHCAPDGREENHVLLCRVVLGRMEKVAVGSQQSRPSSGRFDSGVDDEEEPRCFVIWSNTMNACILPEYIVSFIISDRLKELWRRKSMMGHHSFGLAVPGSPSPESSQQRAASLHQLRCAKENCNRLLLGLRAVCERFAAAGGQGRRSVEELYQLNQRPSFSFPTLFTELRAHLPLSSMRILEHLYCEVKAGNVKRERLIQSLREIAGDEVLRKVINTIRGKSSTKLLSM